MLKSSAKTLLKNVIRHTDTHNRMLEEADMWRQKVYLKKRDEESLCTEDSRRSYLYDNRSDLYFDDSNRSKRHAHMDDVPQPMQSTFWMRKLDKAESADHDRWGHSGYKELYPEEFKPNRSCSENEENGNKSRKLEKRRKKGKKQKRRKIKFSEDDSDLESNRKRKRNSGCSKHRKHRRSRDMSADPEVAKHSHRRPKRDKRKRKHRSKKSEDPLATKEANIKMRYREMHEHNSAQRRKRNKLAVVGNEDSEPKRQKFQREYSFSETDSSISVS